MLSHHLLASSPLPFQLLLEFVREGRQRGGKRVASKRKSVMRKKSVSLLFDIRPSFSVAGFLGGDGVMEVYIYIDVLV